MAERTARKRRIVKWAMLGAAAILLMPGVYVSSFLVCDWMVYRAQVPGSSINYPMVCDIETTLFQPILNYEATELPGTYLLTAGRIWCALNAFGQDASWNVVERHTIRRRRERQEQRANASRQNEATLIKD